MSPDAPAIHTPVPLAALPRGCTSFKLRQLSRRVSQHFDARLAVAGLKTTQYSLLSHVLRLGPVRPLDLAAVMTMDKSTLTRNLGPLVAAGWVTIGPGSDARSRLVSLTPAGAAKHGQARRSWRAAQDALNAALGVERVTALHTLIDESLARLAPATVGDDDE